MDRRAAAAVMKAVPRFLTGPFRNALNIALAEATVGNRVQDLARQERGWKLFLLLPRLLLHRRPRGGVISRDKLQLRFAKFARGEWLELLQESEECDERAATARHRQRHNRQHDLERRANRALQLVQLGELSSARVALEGAEIAPGNDDTLRSLEDPTRRPPIARDPIPEDLVNFRPAVEFSLDEALFARTLRSARRGAAGGPSGMTYEHLRPLLDNSRDMQRLHQLGERFARAEVSQQIVDAVRMGRITALRKSDGGVRGIVAGDLFRRLVSRTIAKQLAKEVEAATAPFQYALSTRAGCECVAHVIQGLCEMNPTATITSIDGISAYDSISRRAMLQGLHHLDEGSRVLPFVRLFYGTPSSYLWEDDSGTVHRVRQGEGGEQGDALMPLLFSLGQHRACKPRKSNSDHRRG